MYKLNDTVYVYLFDLKKTLKSNPLNIKRFGRIVNIEPVTFNNKEEGIYTIQCKDHSMTVKTYDDSFNICNLEELLDIIRSCDISDNERAEYVNLISAINEKGIDNIWNCY